MASVKKIDFSTFKFTIDEVRNINECIKEELELSPLLNSVFGQINFGVKNGKEIGFIKTDMGMMLKTGTVGCSPTSSTMDTLGTTKKVWALKSAFFRSEECAQDTSTTFLALARKAGMDAYDLTGTDYYALVQSLIGLNLARTIFLKAFFDDTDIKNVTGGGYLKDGLDITRYNTIDGIFKQLKTVYTADAKRRVTISENGAATKTAQLAITDANCTKVFNDLLRNADPRLANDPDKIYLSTRSLVQGYRWDMQTKGLDSLMQKQIDGVKVDTCNGIPILEMGLWDTLIQSSFDNGTKYESPHRAILTTKDQLALAFTSTNGFENFDTFFDRVTKKNIIEGEDQFDAKILEDYRFQVAI